MRNVVLSLQEAFGVFPYGILIRRQAGRGVPATVLADSPERSHRRPGTGFPQMSQSGQCTTGRRGDTNPRVGARERKRVGEGGGHRQDLGAQTRLGSPQRPRGPRTSEKHTG